jgi:hypothetical protein
MIHLLLETRQKKGFTFTRNLEKINNVAIFNVAFLWTITEDENKKDTLYN